MASAAEFYDRLANDYDCLFQDWWSAAEWHAGVIGGLLADRGLLPPAPVLDFACGIGTQALPLAAMGYQVTGTDISVGSVQRARAEARVRGIDVELDVSDMRVTHPESEKRFAAVIACDNALPHLLSDRDLLAALRTARDCLRPDGLLLASVRDYDALVAERPAGVPITVHGAPGARHASGQAWSWSSDGAFVDITVFTLREQQHTWRTNTHETTYRALRRETLTSALRQSGFAEPEWLAPAESGYYQPVIVARAAH